MSELTKLERNAITSLNRLAARWPDTLWLFSASGTLCVMKKDENNEKVFTEYHGIDQDYSVAIIDIENDGGDW